MGKLWNKITGGSTDMEPEPTWKVTEPDAATQRHDELPVAGRSPAHADAEQAIRSARAAQEEPVASGPHGEQEAAPERRSDPERPGWATESPELFPPLQTRSAFEANWTGADPIQDSGVHMLPPTPAAPPEGARCPHCGGRMPTDHELLTEALGWLKPHGNAAMHLFYERLFAAAPELRQLFPERIEEQEEKLLSAIVALLQLFKAGDEEMEKLDSALARYGRSHTRFDPAATLEEYAAVKGVLFGVLSEMLGDRLTARHAAALVRAYEYAAGRMLISQATARFDGEGRRRRAD